MSAILRYLGQAVTLEQGHRYEAVMRVPNPGSAPVPCSQLDVVKNLAPTLASGGFSGVTVSSAQAGPDCLVTATATWSLPSVPFDVSAALAPSGAVLVSLRDLTAGTVLFPVQVAPLPPVQLPPPVGPAPPTQTPPPVGPTPTETKDSGPSTGLLIGVAAATLLGLVALVALK